MRRSNLGGSDNQQLPRFNGLAMISLDLTRGAALIDRGKLHLVKGRQISICHHCKTSLSRKSLLRCNECRHDFCPNCLDACRCLHAGRLPRRFASPAADPESGPGHRHQRQPPDISSEINRLQFPILGATCSIPGTGYDRRRTHSSYSRRYSPAGSRHE